MGVRIFLHSIGLVFNQMGGALRISGVLYLIYVLVFLIALPLADVDAKITWQSIVALFLTILIYIWIAVAWHRFILIDERPGGPVPLLNGERMLAYLGRTLQTAIIVGAAAILGIGGSVFIFAFVTMIPTIGPIISLIGMLVVLALILLIGYRLAPLLPGAAIGRPVRIGEAWAATRGATGPILVVAIASALGAMVIDFPAQLLLHVQGGPMLSSAWLFVTNWVKLMVGVSILTTIYGVYVEKRVLA
jgi:hypothetical protein